MSNAVGQPQDQAGSSDRPRRRSPADSSVPPVQFMFARLTPGIQATTWRRQRVISDRHPGSFGPASPSTMLVVDPLVSAASQARQDHAAVSSSDPVLASSDDAVALPFLNWRSMFWCVDQPQRRRSWLVRWRRSWRRRVAPAPWVRALPSRRAHQVQRLPRDWRNTMIRNAWCASQSRIWITRVPVQTRGASATGGIGKLETAGGSGRVQSAPSRLPAVACGKAQ